MPETDLYGPIKTFLEAQGYVVKGEIGACDVMAVRGDEGPVVVELKERLTLALILQAVDRLTFSDRAESGARGRVIHCMVVSGKRGCQQNWAKSHRISMRPPNVWTRCAACRL